MNKILLSLVLFFQIWILIYLKELVDIQIQSSQLLLAQNKYLWEEADWKVSKLEDLGDYHYGHDYGNGPTAHDSTSIGREEYSLSAWSGSTNTGR